jgi:hypothetical protein
MTTFYTYKISGHPCVWKGYILRSIYIGASTEMSESLLWKELKSENYM